MFFFCIKLFSSQNHTSRPRCFSGRKSYIFTLWSPKWVVPTLSSHRNNLSQNVTITKQFMALNKNVSEWKKMWDTKIELFDWPKSLIIFFMGFSLSPSLSFLEYWNVIASIVHRTLYYYFTHMYTKHIPIFTFASKKKDYKMHA